MEIFNSEKIKRQIDYLNSISPERLIELRNQLLYEIIDCHGTIMPRHYSGRARTYYEAQKLVNSLNLTGEFKPYKLLPIIDKV